MSHLSAERLAALAGPGCAPTVAEREHLARCVDCAGERSAYGALVGAAAAERHAVGARLTDWGTLSAALAREGLLHDRSTDPAMAHAFRPVVEFPPRPRALPTWVRGAAAVLLLAAGVAAGRASAVAGPLAVINAVGDSAGGSGSPAVAPAAQMTVVAGFRSTDEARAALQRYEVAYQRAAAYLADRDASTRMALPDEYRARLAALERAGRTIREAMEDAPYDPVLTGYYLTTLGQREATLRQLNVAVPAGERLNSF